LFESTANARGEEVLPLSINHLPSAQQLLGLPVFSLFSPCLGASAVKKQKKISSQAVVLVTTAWLFR
jgi:hypothetical protein